MNVSTKVGIENACFGTLGESIFNALLSHLGRCVRRVADLAWNRSGVHSREMTETKQQLIETVIPAYPYLLRAHHLPNWRPEHQKSLAISDGARPSTLLGFVNS